MKAAAIAMAMLAVAGLAIAPYVLYSNTDRTEPVLITDADVVEGISVDVIQEISAREIIADILEAEGYLVFESALSVTGLPFVIAYLDLTTAYTFAGKTCYNGGFISLDDTDLSFIEAEVVDLTGYSFSVLNVYHHEDIQTHAVVAECYLKVDLVNDRLSYSYTPLYASSDSYGSYCSEAMDLMQLSRGGLYSYDLDEWLFDDGAVDNPLSLKVYPLVTSIDYDAIKKSVEALSKESLENLLYVDIETTISCASAAIASYLKSLESMTIKVAGNVYDVSELQSISSQLDEKQVLVLSDTLKIDIAQDPPKKVSDFVRFLAGLGAAVAIAASIALSFIPAVGPLLAGVVIGASTEVFLDCVISGNAPDIGRCIMAAVVGGLCAIPGVGIIGGAFIGGLGEFCISAFNGASLQEAAMAFAIGTCAGILIGGLGKGVASAFHPAGNAHVSVKAPKVSAKVVDDAAVKTKTVTEVFNKNVGSNKTTVGKSLDDIDPVREPARYEQAKRDTFGYKDVADLPPVKLPTTFERDLGSWSGEPGNSYFRLNPEHPKYSQIKSVLERYGVEGDGLEYTNGNPYFSPFSKLRINGKDVDTSVVISDMKPEIKVQLSDGTTKSIQGRNFNQAKKVTLRNAWEIDPLDSQSSNYLQADRALAKKLGCSPEEVRKMRQDNVLTWHEVSDGVTMELIPTIVHDAFRHSGGVSQVKALYQSGLIERDWEALLKTRYGGDAEVIGY